MSSGLNSRILSSRGKFRRKYGVEKTQQKKKKEIESARSDERSGTCVDWERRHGDELIKKTKTLRKEGHLGTGSDGNVRPGTQVDDVPRTPVVGTEEDTGRVYTYRYADHFLIKTPQVISKGKRQV